MAGDGVELAKYGLATAGLLWSAVLAATARSWTSDVLSLLLVFAYFAVAAAVCVVYRFTIARGAHYALHIARREARVVMLTRHTRLGRLSTVLDGIAIVMSIVSCVMYVLETYVPGLSSQVWWLLVDAGVSVLFIVDYIMRLVLAIDRPQYVFSVPGIINVVTVLPVLVHTWRSLSMMQGDLSERGSSRHLTFLRLLRLAKLLRVMCALHVVQDRQNLDLYREVFTLVFAVLCLIFTAAGVYQWMENEDACWDSELGLTLWLEEYGVPGELAERGCVHFHEAFYWCMIEVLGRPRLIMEQGQTILMLIVLVGMSVVLIPRQIAHLVSVWQSLNRFQRQKYAPSAHWVRHLVVVGHRDFAALNMLLYELYHSDRGEHPVQDVVLLFAGVPERDIQSLLSHPAYVGHVFYLQGSPLQERDLERACLESAAGVIVVANKHSDQPRWHDGELVSCIQSMKAYWLKGIVQTQRQRHFGDSSEAARKFLRPRIVAQVLLPETKEYLVALPGWTNRDVVVVSSEYIAWMLGMAVLAQGMATVVFNLTSHIEVQSYYRTMWYQRYEAGATQELYSATLTSRSNLLGTMERAAMLLAAQRCVLMAVERKEVRGDSARDFAGIHLFPGPEGFHVRKEDRIFCIAQSCTELIAVLEEQEKEELQLVNGRTRKVLRRGNTLDQSRQLDAWVELKDFDNGSEPLPRGCEEMPSSQSAGEGLQPEDVGLSHGHSGSQQGLPAEASDFPAGQPTPPDKGRRKQVLAWLCRREPRWEGHVLLCGLPQTQAGRLGGRGLVTELMETLQRASGLGPGAGAGALCICVVDTDAEQRIADLCLAERLIEHMALSGRLRAVSADPRRRPALLECASLATAHAVLALPEHVGHAFLPELSTVEMQEGRARQKMVKQILDTNTVLTAQVARGCCNRLREEPSSGKQELQPIHSVTLLLQESTPNVFFGHANMRHGGSAAVRDPRWMDIAPLNMSPLFASGELLAMTCFDRFAVEALFTPQVVPLTRMLLFGDGSGHRLYQVPCPEHLVGEAYDAAQAELLSRRKVLIGLLRHPDVHKRTSPPSATRFPRSPGSDRSEDLPDATLPYVMTNPAPGTAVLRAADMLYLLGSPEEPLVRATI